MKSDLEKFSDTYNINDLKKKAKDNNMAKKLIKNDPKISFKKGAIRAAIAMVAFVVVSLAVMWLNKAGVVVSEENKAELIKMIIQIVISGGALSTVMFAGQNANKKHYKEE